MRRAPSGRAAGVAVGLGRMWEGACAAACRPTEQTHGVQMVQGQWGFLGDTAHERKVPGELRLRTCANVGAGWQGSALAGYLLARREPWRQHNFDV